MPPPQRFAGSPWSEAGSNGRAWLRFHFDRAVEEIAELGGLSFWGTKKKAKGQLARLRDAIGLSCRRPNLLALVAERTCLVTWLPECPSDLSAVTPGRLQSQSFVAR